MGLRYTKTDNMFSDFDELYILPDLKDSKRDVFLKKDKNINNK